MKFTVICILAYICLAYAAEEIEDKNGSNGKRSVDSLEELFFDGSRTDLGPPPVGPFGLGLPKLGLSKLLNLPKLGLGSGAFKSKLPLEFAIPFLSKFGLGLGSGLAKLNGIGGIGGIEKPQLLSPAPTYLKPFPEFYPSYTDYDYFGGWPKYEPKFGHSFDYKFGPSFAPKYIPKYSHGHYHLLH